jgi:hypothetical protein
MTRMLIAATVAATFFATNLLAAETVSPLAPGKPAGVTKAQANDNTTLYYILGVGALGGILLGLSTAQHGSVVPTATAGAGASTVTTT